MLLPFADDGVRRGDSPALSRLLLMVCARTLKLAPCVSGGNGRTNVLVYVLL
jgi:hypothetical protein